MYVVGATPQIPDRDRRLAILFVAGFGRVAPSAQAPSGQAPKRLALVGGMLLTGYDVPPIHNAVVLIEGTKITAIGTQAEVKIPAGTTIVDTSGKTMLPGLIETHGHVVVLGAGDYATWFPWINAHGGDTMLTKVMEIAAKQFLMAGVTTEVDLGAPLSVLSVRDSHQQGRDRRHAHPGQRSLDCSPRGGPRRRRCHAGGFRRPQHQHRPRRPQQKSSGSRKPAST
jgi:hypothetical protein